MSNKTELIIHDCSTVPIEDYNCIDCGEHDGFYLVKDHIWNKVAPEWMDLMSAGLNTFLCFYCLELRLGRKLKASDFVKCIGNKGILFGFERGKCP